MVKLHVLVGVLYLIWKTDNLQRFIILFSMLLFFSDNHQYWEKVDM